MQLKFWIDDSNYVTVLCQLEKPGPGEDESLPDVVAARVSDSKLSDIKVDQLLDIAGQIVDHLTQREAPRVSPQDDWRDAFRRGQ